jgi:hypothetical protein
MKVWTGYGSEHSMNLVMIGLFKEASDARDAKDLIADLVGRASKEPIRSYKDDLRDARFSDEMLDFLVNKSKISTLGPAEVEQFAYDVNVAQIDNKLILRTDESDVSGFIKLLIERGAKVEIFSAHDHPDEI